MYLTPHVCFFVEFDRFLCFQRKNMYSGQEAPQMNGDTPHDAGHGGGGGDAVGEELQRTKK